jgi:hypothetical protein
MGCKYFFLYSKLIETPRAIAYVLNTVTITARLRLIDSGISSAIQIKNITSNLYGVINLKDNFLRMSKYAVRSMIKLPTIRLMRHVMPRALYDGIRSKGNTNIIIISKN